MREGWWKTPLAVNIRAAVITWVAMAVTMLLSVGALVLFAGWFGIGTSAAWVWVIAVLGSLALYFCGGFLCSRLAESRAGVWFLIALLLLPPLLGDSAQVGVVNIRAPSSGWLVALIGIPFAVALSWLFTILPVLAGANYEERHRAASR